MTITATNRYPDSGAVDVSPTVHPSFRLETDADDIVSVRVWLAGEEREPELRSTGLGGYDVVVAPREPFAEEDTVTVRVVADSTEITWQFTTARVTGPILHHADPAPGVIASVSPTTIEIQLTNQPLARRSVVSAVPATFDGNDVTSAGVEFQVGNLMIVLSGPDSGEKRNITQVYGVGYAEYDGAPLADGYIDVYNNDGMDVFVDGQRLYHSGISDPDAEDAGWVLSLSVAGVDDFLITAQPPAPLEGTVRVGIKVPGYHDVRASVINYTFDVGDTRGPQVVNVTPDPDARGHDVGSDVEFDVVCVEGVTQLDVVVNGTLAIDDGVPQVGDYSGSTVTPITDGYHVVLSRTSNWPDGDLAFIDITSQDSSARAGERRVLRHHFGAVLGSMAVAASTPLRVVAYDVSDTGFGDPETRGHTGFAWDGYWYQGGARTNLQASWPAPFPVAGHVVFTATGWEIYPLGESTPWLTCTAATPPYWSMAGSGTVYDGDFGGDVLITASQGAVVVVDFVNDRAELYDVDGRVVGVVDIAHRDDDQTGTDYDDDYALPAGPYTHVTVDRDEGSLVLAVGTSGAMTVARALTSTRESQLMASHGYTASPPVAHTRTYPGTWVRPRIVGMALALGYNESTQGQVEVWDWYKWHLGTAELFLDNGTTPALPSAEIADLDMAPGVVAAAMTSELDIVDVSASTIEAHTAASLSLTTLVAVGLESNFEVGVGNVFVADATRVIRLNVPTDDVVIVEDGVAVTNLSPIGVSLHHVDAYVRTSMEIA